MDRKIESIWDLNIDRKNYLELWKWFTDDASRIKDRMWTMATFFYTIPGALLGFVVKHLVSDNNGRLIENVKQPELLLAVAIAGCVLSRYGIFILWIYGSHIRNGWNRADYLYEVSA